MKRWRILATVAAVGIAAWLFGDSGKTSNPPDSTAAERGRRVYLSEGCIHCHSQYIRPGSRDEKIWGSARDVKFALEAQPVLIGNRRQGPDLSNVGARRSTAWLKAHFIEPRTLVPKSPMPSYAHLFADNRGDDLVSYLAESGKERIENVREKASQWKPGSTAAREDGKVLFSNYCAACHGASGLGDGPLARNFSKLPANLTKGPFLWTPAGGDLETRVARVIKFGVQGTDMPGHEVMTDAQIMALTEEVLLLRKNPMAK
jgi:cytochrome c oxidase cbb3-type subunit 2